MPVYTVHAPVAPTTTSSVATDRFVFIRDGFHFWALVFGPLWLLVHRLWLALLGYVVIVGMLEIVLRLLRVGPAAQLLVMVLVAVLTGLEATSLWRWSYSRRNWRGVGLVVADDVEAAERRFFESLNSAATTQGITAGLPPSSPSASPRSDAPVLGLFPEPGGIR